MSDDQNLSVDQSEEGSMAILEQELETRDGSAGVEFQSFWMTSKFQRIFSSTLQRGVGFEAFFQGSNAGEGSTISSKALLSRLDDIEELAHMDRLRLLIHLKNFKAAGVEDRWLFVNLHSRLMLGRRKPDVAFLGEALKHVGLAPHQVVVALREHSEEDQAILSSAVKSLKDMGCLIAFDHFLSKSANLDSLWRLGPEIVKLNRTWMENARESGRAKRMLAKLISLVHASGSLILMEQIETEGEAFMAMRLEADFVQGRFWGSLDAKPVRRGDGATGDAIDQAFALLLKRSEEAVFRDERRHNLKMGYFTGEFLECAWALADGLSLKKAGGSLLQLPRVERLYLLDSRGVQIAADVLPSATSLQDPRYKPIQDSKGATWTRRSSFQDAIRNPGVVQLSRPYRSNASRNVCTTLSVTVNLDTVNHVLCCDVEWQEDVIL